MEGVSVNHGLIFFPWVSVSQLGLMHAKSLQSCLTLCDPTDGSPPGSAVPGISQARILEWVAIFFSNAWKWKVKVKSPSPVQLFATPWTAAYQAPPSMGFSRQEYWCGVPLPSPGLMHIHVQILPRAFFTPITLAFNTNRFYSFLRLNSRSAPCLRKWLNPVATLNNNTLNITGVTGTCSYGDLCPPAFQDCHGTSEA